MRIEKSEKKVFIWSETEDTKSEVELKVECWRITLNGTFNIDELLEWLRELGYKQLVYSNLTTNSIPKSIFDKKITFWDTIPCIDTNTLKS